MLHVLAPHISCVVTEDAFDEALKSYAEIYIICKNGKILRHARLSGGRHIRLEVKEIPGLKEELKELTPEIREEVNFLPNGKIPVVLLEEIIQFFRDVMTIKKAEQEAMAHILYNQKDAENEYKGYRIAIPNQVVSKASVKYESDHIKPGDIIVLDIHSHNTMGAFFSGTDNSDDRKIIGYSAVVGHLDKREPQIVARLNVNDLKKEATIEEIFSIQAKEIKVPAEWLDKVKTYSHVYSGKQTPVSGWGGKRQNRKDTGKEASDGNWYHHSYPDVYSDLYTEADLEADHRLALEHMGIPWMGREAGEESKSQEIIVYNQGQNKDQSKVIDFRDARKEERLTGKKPINIDEIDSLPLVSDDYDVNCINYGKDVADAFEQIEAWMPELEGIDDLLLCVISNAYMLLSIDGQAKLAETGL